jgi:hypothetical protein
LHSILSDFFHPGDQTVQECVTDTLHSMAVYADVYRVVHQFFSNAPACVSEMRRVATLSAAMELAATQSTDASLQVGA